MIKLTVVIIHEYHCCQLHTKFCPAFLSKLTPNVDEITGVHQHTFLHNISPTDQILCIHHTMEKKLGHNGRYISCLQTSRNSV